MSDLSEIALSHFHQNFNCAQAVFSAFAPQLNLSEDTAVKIASPFGGGIVRQGQVCGAVTGALMALGLGRGGVTPAKKEEAYRLGQEFIRRFKTKHSTLLCRELIAIDLSTSGGWQLAKDTGVFDNICPILVHDAAEITGFLLET